MNIVMNIVVKIVMNIVMNICFPKKIFLANRQIIYLNGNITRGSSIRFSLCLRLIYSKPSYVGLFYLLKNLSGPKTTLLGLRVEKIPTDLIASSILGNPKLSFAEKIASCTLFSIEAATFSPSVLTLSVIFPSVCILKWQLVLVFKWFK